MDKIKCLLINPTQSYYKGFHEFNVYFPIGLYSIKANTSNANIDIYDCLVENFKIKKKSQKIFYGSHIKDILKKVSSNNYKIVGISCPFTSQLSNTIRISKTIKENFPNIKIVLGGPAISFQSEEIINKYPFIDFCIKGEGEIAFSQLINNYNKLDNLSTIPNLTFKHNQKIINNPIKPILKLDNLKVIEYHLIDFKKYLQHPYIYKHRSNIPQNSFSMITSRGCPFQCNFCSINLHMTRVYRAHSPSYIFDQIKLLNQKYGIKNFHFEDDNMSQIPNRFEKILDLIIKNKIKIKWDTPNGIRIDTLNSRIIKKIKKSGCANLTVAIESGVQKTIDNIINKKLDLKKAEAIIKIINNNKINLSAFFIIGFPEETKNDMQNTVDYSIYLYKKYKIHPMLFVAMPLPGTSLYKQCQKNNLFLRKISEKNIYQAAQRYGKILIKSSYHSSQDIKDCLDYFYKNTKVKFNIKWFIKKNLIIPLIKLIKIREFIH